MKKVDLNAVALWAKVGTIGIELNLLDTYNKLPESDDGVPYPFEDFEADYYRAKDAVRQVLQDRIGETPIPDPEIPVDPVPEPEEPELIIVPAYNNTVSYPLRPANSHRNFNWLNHAGGYYGKSIKVVFNTGESFTVKDGEVSTDSRGVNNKGGMDMYWFSGNDWKPGVGEFNPSPYEPGKGLASVFSKPGSPATSFTINFNR